MCVEHTTAPPSDEADLGECENWFFEGKPITVLRDLIHHLILQYFDHKT